MARLATARTLPTVAPYLADTLDEIQYAKLADVVGRKTGIKLPAGKRSMVEGRLRKRVRALGFDSVSDYSRQIFESGSIDEEMIHLIDAITTNKTDFFREPGHFDVLERTIAPTLLAARGRGSNPLLKVWSAASSNGAEAYTIAMVLADLAAQRRDFRFSILGTDISTAMLDQAERAIYPADMVSPVPPAKQARYVLRSVHETQFPEVRMAPELRRLAQFRWLNLMDKTYPFDRDVDVIFLRNVLIYFEKADQAAVITRLSSHLRDGGYLILGHAESMLGTGLVMRQIAPSVFQKVA